MKKQLLRVYVSWPLMFLANNYLLKLNYKHLSIEQMPTRHLTKICSSPQNNQMLVHYYITMLKKEYKSLKIFHHPLLSTLYTEKFSNQ